MFSFFENCVATSLSTGYSYNDPVQKCNLLRRNLCKSVWGYSPKRLIDWYLLGQTERKSQAHMGLKLMKCPHTKNEFVCYFSQITACGNFWGLKAFGGVCCVQWCAEGKGCVPHKVYSRLMNYIVTTRKKVSEH
jgi:hypothetical protein